MFNVHLAVENAIGEMLERLFQDRRDDRVRHEDFTLGFGLLRLVAGGRHERPITILQPRFLTNSGAMSDEDALMLGAVTPDNSAM
ncbi:MAG: hypothetical protein ACFB2Z_07365 [Maricaulaceae bacterium]